MQSRRKVLTLLGKVAYELPYTPNQHRPRRKEIRGFEEMQEKEEGKGKEWAASAVWLGFFLISGCNLRGRRRGRNSF